MLATCYLPRKWPSKYFRLCRSLRPCSGWERVVYLRLVTNKLVVCCYRLFSASAVHWRLHNDISLRFHLWLSNSCFRFCDTLSPALAFVRLLLHTPQSFTSFYSRKTSVHFAPCFFEFGASLRHSTQNLIRKSPRPISIAWLKMLPLLHLRPINVVICNGTY